MRKKIAVSALLIIVSFFFFYILFFQQEFKKTIHINLPTITVTEQFSIPYNLKKWATPFSATLAASDVSIDSMNNIIRFDEHQIEIQNLSIYSSKLVYSKGNSKKQFILSALPDTGRRGGSSLTLFYIDTYFKKWFGQGELNKNIIKSFSNFKDYTEDSKRMYGFEINPVKVIDTAFLFIRKTVPLSERRIATRTIFENLIAYAEKRDAGYNGIRIFYSLKSGDEITLFASIGIARYIDIPESEPYEYKMMPFDKNLLEVTYQGTYSGAEKVYDALKAFKQDHNLTSMAIPFQKFISNGYDFADDQVVQLKVYYPVF